MLGSNVVLLYTGIDTLIFVETNSGFRNIDSFIDLILADVTIPTRRPTMDKTSTSNDGGIILDSFGQQILPIYTQICLCFPINDPQAYPRVIETLNTALERLHVQFPWLAGRVVNEGATASSTGVFKIKTIGEAPRLVVKDLREDSSFPSMEALQLARFPINALDEVIVAPRKTQISADDSAGPKVLLVQANLIKGGLILTFLGQHQAMDGIGQDQVIRLFSKACRNEAFTTEELSTCNLTSTSDTIPLLDPPHDLQVPPTVSTYQLVTLQTSYGLNPPPCSWAYFSFNKSSLQPLKSNAAQTCPPGSAFISTDDALSAFIWKSITSIRLSRLEATTPSTFARAVDVRHMLGISGMHPGFVQNMTYNTFTFQELLGMPLGVLASHLRSRIDPKTSTLAHDTRALATLLTRSEDRSCVSFAASLKSTSDIFFSSWVKMGAYEYDFGGVLGRAEAVRRTRSHVTEGLMYLMPKTPDGEVGLVACLSDVDMLALRRDGEFGRFAEFIG